MGEHCLAWERSRRRRSFSVVGTSGVRSYMPLMATTPASVAVAGLRVFHASASSTARCAPAEWPARMMGRFRRGRQGGTTANGAAWMLSVRSRTEMSGQAIPCQGDIEAGFGPCSCHEAKLRLVARLPVSAMKNSTVPSARADALHRSNVSRASRPYGTFNCQSRSDRILALARSNAANSPGRYPAVVPSNTDARAAAYLSSTFRGQPAAVQMQDLPRDVAGTRSGKKQDGPDDVGGLATRPSGMEDTYLSLSWSNQPRSLTMSSRPVPPQKGRLDGPRRHHIGAHTRSQFHGECLGQADQGALLTRRRRPCPA